MHVRYGHHNTSRQAIASDEMKKGEKADGPEANEMAPLLMDRQTSGHQVCIDWDAAIDTQESSSPSWSRVVNGVGVNCLSGGIAFMLTSTIAVSTASVLVGTATPLSAYVANAIDMHLLGTAIMCLFLSWQSTVPYAMGAIDASIVPILAEMAQQISTTLQHDMSMVVPTVLVASAIASVFIGCILFLLGYFRLTSVVNYLPFPVIAGFLSGLGGVLIKDGFEVSANVAFPTTLSTLTLASPTVLFALLASAAKPFHVSPTVVFPILILGSIGGFHAVAWASAMDQAPWLYNWSPRMLNETRRWYSWVELSWGDVQWSALAAAIGGIAPTLLLLVSLKYSVLIGSLSTIFQRNINIDVEVQTIGKANIIAGLVGCCGGTHYVSAMALMANFQAHPRIPVLICAALHVALWAVGLAPLLVIPKFVFGGLLMYIGLHFLENYMVAPASFLSRLELLTILATIGSFLTLGVLPSMGVGIVLSMLNAVLNLHVSGCIHHDVALPEHATYVVHLHGNLSFANAMQVHTVVDTEWQTRPFQTLVLDFERVVLVDGSFLQILRRLQTIADRCHFAMHLCHVPSSVEAQFATLSLPHLDNLNHIMQRHRTCHHNADSYGALHASWTQYVAETGGNGAPLAEVVQYLDAVETLAPHTTVDSPGPGAWGFLCRGHLDIYDANLRAKVGHVRSGRTIPNFHGDMPHHTIVAATECVVVRMHASSWRQLQVENPPLAISLLEQSHIVAHTWQSM
ncbi:hypothetical protein H310_03029 [Aphanomyces invadans]|uniref:STAS domain-containing protein n=2 Tax=Aphanomyces invadans TaxID=157072 RepID=A0A024UKW8_9STRA|nr:hypothetical protein H310_03029 [Aphanomyces invadans]ETW06914.1 hypothetical protein H310_03029 [Aphanomyces invadans]|eukprot:XP_008864989.1 hypothetical protein H310_03029 [Aphanomyces invadans]